MQEAKEYIDSPVFFFFELGTTNLTDKLQLVNLDELARIAKKYGLTVKVVGAADEATGSDEINDPLGASRARYISVICLILSVIYLRRLWRKGSNFAPWINTKRTIKEQEI